MRTLILALAVVLLAAPAWATVEITLTDLGGGKIEVGYDATDETDLVRAFALDIVSHDGNIVDCCDYAVGDNNGGYGIFPGNFSRYITVNTTTGNVDNWGIPGYTPVADAGDPSALGGLDTNGITIEMGALYDDAPPLDTGVLCIITVEEGVSKVCVTGNAIRGNVVLEDASEAVLDPPEVCLSLAEPDCFPNTPAYAKQYADWVTYGKPDCWCNSSAISGTPTQLGDYQCDGDTDGKTEGILTKYRVSLNDLNQMIPDWKKKIGANPNPCNDVDHKAEGLLTKYRVSLNDLNIIIDNWKKKDTVLPGDCPRPD
jgi:hypothetical protein